MVLVALGVLASGSVVPAALLMAMTAFIGGVVAIYGASGTAFGLLIPIITLITLGIDPPQAELVPLATAALAGGVWASLVSIAPWPFLGRIPAARMVTAVFDAVADQLETIVQCGTAGLHDPRVTESRIELAEKYQQSDAHGRHARIGHKKQGGQFYAALVEDVSIAMVLLRSAQREVDGPWPPMTDADVDLFEQVANYCRACGEAIAQSKDVPQPPESLLATIADLEQATPGLREELSGVSESLLALGQASVHEEVAVALPWWQTLHMNLSWSSPLFRHAWRLAVAAALATVIFEISGVKHGAWIILTVVVLLKSGIGATLDRLVQRLIGTLIGVLVGAALIIWLQGWPVVMVLVAAGFLFLMVSFIRLNYLYWVLALTPFVLLTLALPAQGDWTLAGWRLLHTAIGAVLVVAAVFLLWPTRGEQVVPKGIARTLRVIQKYLALVASGAPIDARRQLRGRAALEEFDARGALRSLSEEPGQHHSALRANTAALSQTTRIRDLVMRLDHRLTLDPAATGAPGQYRKADAGLTQAARCESQPAGSGDEHRSGQPRTGVAGGKAEASPSALEDDSGESRNAAEPAQPGGRAPAALLEEIADRSKTICRLATLTGQQQSSSE